MAHIWARIQAFDQVSRFLLFKPAVEGLLTYIYFLLFEETHQNPISKAGEKISNDFALFA